MKKAMLGLVALVTIWTAIPSVAVAATPRQDAYYEIWCTVDEDPTTTYLAKIVDARAIQLDKEPGGKDTATEKFNANNPYGEHCVESGPFAP